VLETLERRLPLPPARWTAAAMTWASDAQRFEVLAVQTTSTVASSAPVHVALTSPDCLTWTEHPVPPPVEPYARGVPVHLGTFQGTDQRRLDVIRGQQPSPWIRPNGGGEFGVLPRDVIYRGYAPAESPFDYYWSEQIGRLRGHETLPALEGLSDERPEPSSFPVRVHHILPDLGFTAFVTTDHQGAAIYWPDRSAVRSGLQDERAVARRALLLATPSGVPGSFDQAHVEAAAAVVEAPSLAAGDAVSLWLFYRGFERVEAEAGTRTLVGGEIGAVHARIQSLQ